MSRFSWFFSAVFVPAVLFSSAGAMAGDRVPTERDSCWNHALSGGLSHRLTKGEREIADRLAERAEVLASGVLRVEEILEQADYAHSEFSGQGIAWAAVLQDEAYRVGVYRVREERLERLDLLSGGDDPDVSARFTLAEQAMANTPSDCSRSFGVLDQGLESDNGGRALYAIQLVDRSLELAWGMHYRFEVLDGKLQRLDRLHVRCSVIPVVPAIDIESPKWRDKSFVMPESLPGMDLPTEAQLMQLHLYQDLPGSPDFLFLAEERLFEVPHGQTRLPERYERKMNPCSLAES